jgi:hypothetical protein
MTLVIPMKKKELIHIIWDILHELEHILSREKKEK